MESASELQREIERCHREIAEIERQLRAGNPEVQGLCLALSDWSAELKIIEATRAPHNRGAAMEDTLVRLFVPSIGLISGLIRNCVRASNRSPNCSGTRKPPAEDRDEARNWARV